MEQNLFGNKTVLVTGASGIVGAHLCIALAQQAVSVRAFVRNHHSQQKAEQLWHMYSIPAHITKYITWVYGDITVYQDVSDAVSNTSYVFHCAGYVSFNNADRKTLFDCNVIGTAHVVNACLEHAVTKLCHVSSVAALGKTYDGSEITEQCEYEQKKSRSVYGYSKFLGELEVWRGIAEGLSAVIVNPSVIIAPGFWNQSSGKLFTTISRGLQFYTSGVTGYVSVHDVTESMIYLMKSNISGERFIVSAENLDYKTVFTSIAASIGVKPPKWYAPRVLLHFAGIMLTFFALIRDRQSEITRQTAQTAYAVSLFSSEKLTQALGFKFRSVEKEIQITGTFFRG